MPDESCRCCGGSLTDRKVCKKCFQSTSEACTECGNHTLEKFHTMNLGENLEKFSKIIPKNGCVFVCNPNNPTGELLEKKQVLYITDVAKSKSSILFVDESFIELVPGKSQSVALYAPKKTNLFVLRSLTKSFAIPGVRAGYSIANKTMTDLINRTSMPWNVSILAACAAVIFLIFTEKYQNEWIQIAVGNGATEIIYRFCSIRTAGKFKRMCDKSNIL